MSVKATLQASPSRSAGRPGSQRFRLQKSAEKLPAWYAWLPLRAGTSRAPLSAFTLIELILVMTVLTIAVSLTAPALANFFRGRSLDSEARKMLALTRLGQSRAVSEGIPMNLWFDSVGGAYGLEAEPTYETTDPKAQEFTVDSDMQLQVSTVNTAATVAQSLTSLTSPVAAVSKHSGLPQIKFLPDGSIAETSPQAFCVMSRDGSAIWLAQTRNRLSYAITNR